MAKRTKTAETANKGEPGVAVVRGCNDALAGGDVAGMVEFLDPQVDWRAPELVPYRGPRLDGAARQDRGLRGVLRHRDGPAHAATSAEGLGAASTPLARGTSRVDPAVKTCCR